VVDERVWSASALSSPSVSIEGASLTKEPGHTRIAVEPMSIAARALTIVTDVARPTVVTINRRPRVAMTARIRRSATETGLSAGRPASSLHR